MGNGLVTAVCELDLILPVKATYTGVLKHLNFTLSTRMKMIKLWQAIPCGDKHASLYKYF